MRPRNFAPWTLALLLAPAAGAAQVPAGGVAGIGAAGGVSYEWYSFQDASRTGVSRIAVTTVPFAVRASLFAGASLELSGAWANGTLHLADGRVAGLRDYTDSQLALTLPVVRDAVMVTAVAILPTGKTRLDENEALVAGVVASELLPFQITNWGAGGAAGVSTALAHNFGTFGVGASAAYLVGRQYDLGTPGAFGYRPGNQLRARLAFDLATGPAGKASLQLTYLHSQQDRFSGTNVFRPGDRFQAMGSYAFAAGRQASAILYAGWLHRAEGAYLVALGATPSAQNLFLGGAGARVPLGGGGAVLMPTVDLRVLRRSTSLDQGEMVGLGSAVELPTEARFTFVPSVRARFGRVQALPGSSTGFNGADIALGVRFGGGAQ